MKQKKRGCGPPQGATGVTVTGRGAHIQDVTWKKRVKFFPGDSCWAQWDDQRTHLAGTASYPCLALPRHHVEKTFKNDTM